MTKATENLVDYLIEYIFGITPNTDGTITMLPQERETLMNLVNEIYCE